MPAYPGAPTFYPGIYFPGDASADSGGGTPVPPTLPPPPDKVAPSAPELTVDSPTSSWVFGIGPRTGGITAQLPQARSRRLSVKLTEDDTASVELDGRDPVTSRINELATDLHVLYRRSPADARVQLYRGRIGKTGDRGDANTHRVSVPSVSYRGVLARRFLFTGSQLTYTGVDQTAIGWALINSTQNATGGGGSLGISDGSTPTGVTRDRTFELEDQIAEKIQQLSEVQNGFDWDIVPVNEYVLEYRTWYPQRGVGRDVLISLPGNVAAFSRDVDSGTFANAIRMNGQAPQGGGDAPPPHERYADDIATAEAGRWEAVIGTDIVSSAGVADRIGWQLEQSQTVRPSYTFTMKRGWWRGPNHCWVGDPVMVKLYSGRLRVDTVLRVFEMEFTPGDDGGEDVTVTVGAPRPNPAKRAATLEQRLAKLERLQTR